MKKILSCLAIVFMMFSSLQVVNAQEVVNNQEDFVLEQALQSEYYMTYDEQGNLTDCNLPQVKIARNSYSSKQTLVGSGFVSGYNNGYHPSTNVWRRVSSYNFSTTSSVSVGVSFGASTKVGKVTVSGTISVSNTTANSFGYTIKTNQSRDSKLSVITDFNWKYYKADVYDNYTGRYQYTYYFSIISKTAERFIPVYR